MKKEKDGAGRTEDEKLWEFVIRTVTPLAGRARPRPEKAAVKKKDIGSAAQPALLPERFPDSGLKPRADEKDIVAGGIDRRTADKLRKGSFPVERILDLHGMRQDEAQQQFFRFLQRSAQSGRRCVMVITGKGRDAEGGVLRKALPHWIGLPAVSGLVLDFSPARPKDGGSGAFYILLRRQR